MTLIPEMVTVRKDLLKKLVEICTSSMDFGSGFLYEEDIQAIRAGAEATGDDPNLYTPAGFMQNYPHKHRWQETVYHRQPDAHVDLRQVDLWRCLICDLTSRSWEMPPSEHNPKRYVDGWLVHG